MANFYFLGTVKSVLGSSFDHYLNQCKIANYDLILTVVLLFALIFFEGPQQYNHPPIYGGYVLSVWIKCRYNVYSMSHHLT